ncbi:hypothetical protein VaNZ11_002029 [Volvox africanus]|uniref:Uncharacterized protein n=1 Tax=Volvox africanus TaxID=51714 RepID=A0ABQ5RQX8_9CHLO|nr:hypothetical protein VaNZ11_002029 [Volvox africanus]
MPLHVIQLTGTGGSIPSTSYNPTVLLSAHRKERVTSGDPLYHGFARPSLCPINRRPRLPALRASDQNQTSIDDKGTSGPAVGSPEQQPSGDASFREPSNSTEPELASMWETIKKDVRKELNPEEAQVLDSIKVDDLLGDTGDLMKKLADEQLGPVLQSLGVSEEPLAFFVDLLRLGTTLQLLSAALLFYGMELGVGLDSGEALRCVCGLTAGYLSRPFFRVEQLLWPLYDWGLRILAPGAVYEVTVSREESQSALTRLGLAVAVCSFVPQLLLGWDTATTVQFVLPLAAGWLLFDITYMAALLFKLQK